MPPSDPGSDFAAMSLAEIARAAGDARMPPVADWHPPHCGDSAMRIARDGTWHHEGAPIARPALVRLFASILRREADGSHALVTPVEKLSIAVDDAPFVAVELNADGDGRDARLGFRLNTDELVIAGPAHPLRLAGDDDGPRPYLLVRAGLEALVARSVYYELAARAVPDERGRIGVWSNGAFFAMAPA